jgi:exopolysaccharide production protein ExoQ
MRSVRSLPQKIDICAIVPVAACAIALIVIPLLGHLMPSTPQEVSNGVARPENRILWPVMAAFTVVLAFQNHSRFANIRWPPNIIFFLLYLSFAGASVLWAFKPEISFTRFAQQVMIVLSVILPAMLARRTSDMMRGLFLCFAFASFLNIFYVVSGAETIAYNAIDKTTTYDLGSPGYFSFKNYLGECAAIAFLLSIHETLQRGRRRVFGIIGAMMSIYLIFASNSKTAFGLALLCPFLSGIILKISKATRLSPAIIPLCVPVVYVVISHVAPHYNLGLLSYKLYGDSTFTGRTFIWDFVQQQIDLRPLLGWGYESFWLVPGSPALAAPGWVAGMPNGHSGYYDTMLDLGYLGFTFLLAFIIATLHGIGRVANRDPIRAWLVLSLALFIIVWNFLERLWMHGFEFLWVVFVIVAAEIGRSWTRYPLRGGAHASTHRKTAFLRPSPGAHTPRARIGLSRPSAPQALANREV